MKIFQFIVLVLVMASAVSALPYDADKCSYVEDVSMGCDDNCEDDGQIYYECFSYECSQDALDDFGKYFYSKYRSWWDYPSSPFLGGWSEKVFFEGECPPENERNHEPTVPMHPTDVPEFSSIGIGAVIAIAGLFIVGKRRK